MDERLMIDEFDAAVSRLLSGAPVASVLAGSSPMVRPYVEAFAHVLVAPTVARPAFRTELRNRLMEGHARRDEGARWALNLRRTAAAAAAAALLGSAVGGALNPALADNLQRSIGETFGEPVAELFDRLVPEMALPSAPAPLAGLPPEGAEPDPVPPGGLTPDTAAFPTLQREGEILLDAVTDASRDGDASVALETSAAAGEPMYPRPLREPSPASPDTTPDAMAPSGAAVPVQAAGEAPQSPLPAERERTTSRPPAQDTQPVIAAAASVEPPAQVEAPAAPATDGEGDGEESQGGPQFTESQGHAGDTGAPTGKNGNGGTGSGANGNGEGSGNGNAKSPPPAAATNAQPPGLDGDPGNGPPAGQNEPADSPGHGQVGGPPAGPGNPDNKGAGTAGDLAATGESPDSARPADDSGNQTNPGSPRNPNGEADGRGSAPDHADGGNGKDNP